MDSLDDVCNSFSQFVMVLQFNLLTVFHCSVFGVSWNVFGMSWNVFGMSWNVMHLI